MKRRQNEIQRNYYNLIRNFIGFKQVSSEKLNIMKLGYASIVPKIQDIYKKNNPNKEIPQTTIQNFNTESKVNIKDK